MKTRGGPPRAKTADTLGAQSLSAKWHHIILTDGGGGFVYAAEKMSGDFD